MISPTLECLISVVSERDYLSSSLKDAKCMLLELEEEIVNVKLEKKALITILEDSEKDIRLLKTENQNAKKILEELVQLSVPENKRQKKNDALGNLKLKQLGVATSAVYSLPY